MPVLYCITKRRWIILRAPVLQGAGGTPAFFRIRYVLALNIALFLKSHYLFSVLPEDCFRNMSPRHCLILSMINLNICLGTRESF